MADLRGAIVEIPGDAWNPPEQTACQAEVLQFYPATRHYPEGRVRIHVFNDNSTHYWDCRSLPRSWVIQMPQPLSPRGQAVNAGASTPGRRKPSARTPSRSRASKAADAEPTSPTGTARAASRGRGRTRRRSSGAGGNVSEGYASEGAAVAPQEPPAPDGIALVLDGTGLVTRRRTPRRRKSIRFADDMPGQPLEQYAPSPKQPSGTASPYGYGTAHDVMGFGDVASLPRHYGLPQLPTMANIRNAMLMVLVAVPAIYYGTALRNECTPDQRAMPLARAWRGLPSLTGSNFWCAVGAQQPLLAVNLVFFLLVDVLFWIISLVQSSTWLIDPYWAIAPVLMGLFYQLHPSAVTEPLRSKVVMALLWVWALRMQHNYFRREGWQCGAREDWRYADMRRSSGRWWWLVSFFAVGVAQHLMLVGISLPLAAVHMSKAEWHPAFDPMLAMAAATGLFISWLSDNQLRAFMLENERRRAEGLEPLPLLETGLWAYSRHPNYFGENLWWWSLAGWAVLCGQPWMVAGAAFNSLCMVGVTLMTEKRMMAQPARAPLYRAYQAHTSAWVPWFKTGSDPVALAHDHAE